MHTPGKGISGSAIPYSRRAPGWLKTTAEEAKELISKLAKKGLTPSQVGIVLRDSHGIGLVKNLTGNKIVRILKSQGKNFHSQISKSGANLHTLRSGYFHFLSSELRLSRTFNVNNLALFVQFSPTLVSIKDNGRGAIY